MVGRDAVPHRRSRLRVFRARARARRSRVLTRGVPPEKRGQLFQQLFEDRTQEDAQKVLAAQATFGAC